MPTEPREKMQTIGGISVRAEIDARLEEIRATAFDEAIAFLRLSGFIAAAEALEQSAFGDQHDA